MSVSCGFQVERAGSIESKQSAKQAHPPLTLTVGRHHVEVLQVLPQVELLEVVHAQHRRRRRQGQGQPHPHHVGLSVVQEGGRCHVSRGFVGCGGCVLTEPRQCPESHASGLPIPTRPTNEPPPARHSSHRLVCPSRPKAARRACLGRRPTPRVNKSKPHMGLGLLLHWVGGLALLIWRGTRPQRKRCDAQRSWRPVRPCCCHCPCPCPCLPLPPAAWWE